MCFTLFLNWRASANCLVKNWPDWPNEWPIPTFPPKKNDCGKKSTGDFTANNMPRIRRQNLPPRLLDHLLDRVDDRNISAAQLGLLANWMRADPEVPEGKWFKKFPGVTVCGEGELIKTFLAPGQVATGEELK